VIRHTIPVEVLAVSKKRIVLYLLTCKSLIATLSTVVAISGYLLISGSASRLQADECDDSQEAAGDSYCDYKSGGVRKIVTRNRAF
jgi:hypothetical protein